MKTIIVSLALSIIILSSGFAETKHDYAQVRVRSINRQHILSLTQKGVDIDHVWDDKAVIYIRSDRLSLLDDMNLPYTVQPDIRNTNGYHSVDDIANHLKALERDYPDICKLYSIGKSYEGRDLWFMKISDNVTEEEDEPEVKYISSMHGDEPVGMELCLNFIDYLTNNYGTDSNVTALVNDIELWIMPLMNPDGYVHQRRYSMENIDLNRDFPDRVLDNNNTTEGRAVETAHLMNFGFSHSFVLAANFHTGALVVNYPYDSDFYSYNYYSATPDDDLFQELALSYSLLNQSMYTSYDFYQGITNGVQWYTAYGSMQDWNYVWRGCNEVTIELFNIKWPSFSTIASIWKDNRESMLKYIQWSLQGIRGMITNAETGQPVNAVARVIGIDHDTYTDPDVGDYHRILLPGTYDMEFSAEGYFPQKINSIVVDDSDKATRIDIRLTPRYRFANIQSAIIILKAMSDIPVDIPLSTFDMNHDGKVGLPEAVFSMKMIAE
ncbi:MAG: succinylglutamate desuccinylase/aspartoacylase family protein [Candidatus Magnetomorum sp.]|nr:succinylglutamate desuccinylase/aspartoacylase family protein [Candidatus Magnetomorum sp.]